MSEVIVLDTHMWIWFVNLAFENFPSEWKERIETASQVGISPVSCYEIALAQHRGRLELPCSTEQWFRAALEPLSQATSSAIALKGFWFTAS
jgi:PIN domain nuclease of toxin-antitoxin system